MANTTPAAPAGLWLLLLIVSAGASLYMAGCIWTVQLAHYALFERVGAEGWATYHAEHTRRMGWVVLLPMVLELGASGLLALLVLPPQVAAAQGAPGAATLRALLWAGAAAAVLTWAVTFFVSVPLHGRLAQGFEAAACRALVQTNWARTALWTAHALIVLETLRRLLLPLVSGAPTPSQAG